MMTQTHERSYIGILAFLSLFLLGLLGWQYRGDGTEQRLAALDEEIATIEATPVTYDTSRAVDYDYLNAEIRKKQNLWHEIVPPPPKPKPKQVGPNWIQKLKGIVPSQRRQITKKGKLYILIASPDNVRGTYMSVGDTVNGLTIQKIESDTVTFKLHYGNKDYFKEVPRK